MTKSIPECVDQIRSTLHDASHYIMAGHGDKPAILDRLAESRKLLNQLDSAYGSKGAVSDEVIEAYKKEVLGA